MTHININGCNYYYQLYDESATDETIVFSHGLLLNGKMFDKQVEQLKKSYRVMVYDHRGQGKSEVTAGGYDMDQLYEDAVSLIETLKLGKVHFAGLSMGGFIGMRLAARRPELVRSLILMETSAEIEPLWLKNSILVILVKLFGAKSVAKHVMKIMFGKKFLNDPDREEEINYWTEVIRNHDKTIVRAVGGVLNRKGIENELKNIHCPTLVIVGTDDKATVPAKAEIIHQHIQNSQLKYVQEAGHSSTIEEPDLVNGYIEKFLKER